jgi:DNA-directed RNA polymerase specialized sigma24 family protein
MNLCVEGSEEAFRELMRRFHPRIVNVVYRYINDPVRAEEIAQEVFVRVYVHRERYRRTALLDLDLHDSAQPDEERDSTSSPSFQGDESGRSD